MILSTHCLTHTGTVARLRPVAPMSTGTRSRSRVPPGHPTNIKSGALATNNDRHQDATCFVLNGDHPAFCSRHSTFNLTVRHHAACQYDCVRMRCREVAKVLPDEIGDELVVHCEVKIKV